MRVGKRICRVLLLIFFLSLSLMVVSTRSIRAARVINSTVCDFSRELLGKISASAPFSIFEAALFLSPLIIILCILYVVCGGKDIKARFVRALSAISVIPTLYVLTVGVASYDKLPITAEVTAPSFEELVLSSEALVFDVNETSPTNSVEFTLEEIFREIEKSYFKTSHGYGVKAKRLPYPKTFFASFVANKLGLLGHYSPITGEVGINLDIPPYMIPFTLAHEYAHYLGVASEGEASFIAFAVCHSSDVPYIKYSATLSILEYFLSDVYKCDRSEYARIYSSISDVARADLKKSYEYTVKYSCGIIYRTAEDLNSSYIGALDKSGNFGYLAVCRYVTQYLLHS